MNIFVYILYSKSKDTFYIGYTKTSIQERIEKHLNSYYPNAFTRNIKDWKIFYSIECDNEKQAINIERHLKRMKSKVYLRNLKTYPEISEKLLLKYL